MEKTMSDEKPTDANVPTGIDAPKGPKKDWKDVVFSEDKNDDLIDVPTGIDSPGTDPEPNPNDKGGGE
jgi:hypothetical protein